MILGLILTGVGWALTSQAELVPTSWRPGWLLVTYVVASAGMVLYFVNFIPFLMGHTGLVERDHAFSAAVSLEPLGGFIGSLIGGFLPGLFAGLLGVSSAAPGPFRYTLLTSALLLVPAILLLLATSEASLAPVEERPAKDDPAPVAVLAVAALCLALWLAGRGSADTFFNVYLDISLAAPTGQIGALQATGQLVAVPAVLVMPLLVGRWGQGRTIIFAGLGAALGLLLIALVPHWSTAGLGLMAMIAFFSITNATVIVYSQEIVAPGWREAMSGAMNAAGGVGLAAMALGGGYAIPAVGYRGVFFMGMACMAAGALVFWAYFRLRHAELGRR
jgi:Na+/melibiose symporter-like transporter